MIGASLQYLAMQLNLHLRRTMAVREDLVVVSRILENDGKEYEGAVNKLNLFLVNLERDSMVQNRVTTPEVHGDRAVVPPKMVYLNLYFVIAANFKGGNYVDSLRYLSKAVAFFQDHTFFERTNWPDMPEGLEKLFIDMECLNMQELNNLWGMVGAKYVPSVVYRMKTVALGGDYSYYQPYVVRFPENSELGMV
jgi:hypothetical protein